MKRFIKTISVTLALLLLLLPITVFAGVTSEGKNYVMESSYANVDWDNWKAYKVQLHCHTNASDGYLTVKEVVQKSYDLGYDAVAITDHGTINKGWNVVPDLVPIIRLVKYERTELADIVPLTDEEYNAYLNGTAPTTNGTVRENGMLDIPKGIELNAATPIADCHLTGYFSDYGQGLIGVYGDYETPSKGVKDAGGISMLSHVGEYVYTDKDSENYVGQPVDEYYVNKFSRLFLDNAGSSVGMGINSATDAHTRCDRILYDSILQKTIPHGVVPWGFTFSDSHDEASLNNAYTMHYMPELSNVDLRYNMETGAFFSVSHFSNGVELNGMREMPEYIEEEVDAYSNDTPLVTRIDIDEELDTISIEGENFDTITWVSDGKVLKRGGLEATTLDLDDFKKIGCYVRFYITGEHGICYSQPIVIREEDVALKSEEVPPTIDTSVYLRKLITFLDRILFQNSVIVDIFKDVVLGY